jgi:hypothetical protein
MESLASDIPAGDRKIVNLFLQCRVYPEYLGQKIFKKRVNLLTMSKVKLSFNFKTAKILLEKNPPNPSQSFLSNYCEELHVIQIQWKEIKEPDLNVEKS